MPPVKRASTVKSPVKMAVVSINHDCYLLPADKAMKLLDLMQDAVRVDKDYDSHDGYSLTYFVRDEPKVELYMVKPSQLRRQDQSQRESRGPLLLEG